MGLFLIASAAVQFLPFILGTISSPPPEPKMAAASQTLGVPTCFATVSLGFGTSTAASCYAVKNSTVMSFSSSSTRMKGSSRFTSMVQ